MRQSFGVDDQVSIAIEKYADMVRRICFLYLNNRSDVEDVFQEVFLKYILHHDALTSEAHEKAWLCRVAFNQCKDLTKSFWRRKVVSIEDMEIPCEDPEQLDLMREILKLPSDQKQIVYLHFYEGRPISEVAEIMGRNQNTVYSMLRRAKAKLRNVL